MLINAFTILFSNETVGTVLSRLVLIGTLLKLNRFCEVIECIG